ESRRQAATRYATHPEQPLMHNSSNRRDFLKQLSAFAATAPFMGATTAVAGPIPRRSSLAEPIAETTSGRVRGFVADGVNVFRGIPYGGDTGGRNRFMPPTPVQAWSGVRDAIEWG